MPSSFVSRWLRLVRLARTNPVMFAVAPALAQQYRRAFLSAPSFDQDQTSRLLPSNRRPQFMHFDEKEFLSREKPSFRKNNLSPHLGQCMASTAHPSRNPPIAALQTIE